MAQHGTYGIEDTYQGVITDVIAQLKDAFLDESVDADVLQQLKKSWETKLSESGAVGLDRHGDSTNKGTGSRKKTSQMAPPNASGFPLLGLRAQFRPPHMENPTNVFHPSSLSVFHGTQYAIMNRPGGAQNFVMLVPTTQMGTPQGHRLMPSTIVQLDGGKGKTGRAPAMTDESSEEEDREEEEDPTLAAIKYGLTEDRNEGEAVEEEEPLNSGDDQSDDEDLDTLFEAENVVVCQFEKVHRARNKWKFTLKDGVMHIHGKDYCFQKCTGEAEW